jgi:hypothetical protein
MGRQLVSLVMILLLSNSLSLFAQYLGVDKCNADYIIKVVQVYNDKVLVELNSDCMDKPLQYDIPSDMLPDDIREGDVIIIKISNIDISKVCIDIDFVNHNSIEDYNKSKDIVKRLFIKK